MKRIYLDYAATTPLDPRVLEAMMPYLTNHFANASSIYQDGQSCRHAIDAARNMVQKLLGAFNPHELIFTGSGTESCNMAIFGAAFAKGSGHLIVSAIEHPAVLEPARFLRDNFGFTLTEVLPTPEGLISPEAVEEALQEDTMLVSIAYANNEIGTIQPIKKIAKLCRNRDVLFHTDACQAPGFLDINVAHLGVDLMSINGSKIYGPKGSGLLYVRQGVHITPLIHGGGQEFRMRGGTENTANIVGFAKALELILDDSKERAARIAAQRDAALAELLELPGISLNGAREPRLPNNINLYVAGHSGETLVMRLDLEGIAVSSGSACSSGKTEASHVLRALGQSEEQAKESLRISIGKHTNAEDLSIAINALKKVLS